MMPATSWAMMRTTAPGKEMAPCTNMATDTLGFTWEPPETMSHSMTKKKCAIQAVQVLPKTPTKGQSTRNMRSAPENSCNPMGVVMCVE